MSSKRALAAGAALLCLSVSLKPGTTIAHGDNNPGERGVMPITFLDIERYAGTWVEIARIPNWFQRQCVRNTKAEYRVVSKDRIQVINSCEREDGTVDAARGIARVADSASNAKLEVSFFKLFGRHFFWGDYWVLGLDAEYQYAFVGTPDRSYGWLLARDTHIDPASLNDLRTMVSQNGFDLDEFIFSKQPAR